MSSTFSALGVPARLADRLAGLGITTPFPIQAATLPDGLKGRDVCGRAPTGSGKTLAFGIPLVARVAPARPRHPRALVLVPTRELAAQVHQELALLAGRDRRVASFYGGLSFGPQISSLRAGVDIAVACPGRLADLVRRSEVKLDEVTMVVVDEADRMADMGFLPQVRALLDLVPSDRQTFLFSATLDGAVKGLVSRYQSDPARFEVLSQADAVVSQHVFWQAERTERLALTARVVSANWPAIVFCRTKRGAERLTRQLVQAGVAAAALHGDRSQAQRQRALGSFMAGRTQALVATDVVARGIHVDDVACVVHFDPPEDDKAYVHRSGRTGRAGATGIVVSLVGKEETGDIRKRQAKLALPQGIHPPDLALLGANTLPRRAVAKASPSGQGGGPAALDAGASGIRPPRRPHHGGAGSRRRATTR